jgi:Tfp pilus assembly protein PilF
MDRIASLKDFLKQTPDDSFLKHALALEYIKLGNDTDARQLFEELLAHDPGYVGSWYHLGKLLERVGEEKQAIAVYEKGMEMAKAANNRHAYNELQMALDDLL